MPRGPKGEKRPADVIGNAVKVMRIATGEEPEDYGPSVELQGKDPAAVALGRKGGKARAAGMSARKRKEIAERPPRPGGGLDDQGAPDRRRSGEADRGSRRQPPRPPRRAHGAHGLSAWPARGRSRGPSVGADRLQNRVPARPQGQERHAEHPPVDRPRATRVAPAPEGAPSRPSCSFRSAVRLYRHWGLADDRASGRDGQARHQGARPHAAPCLRL